MKVPISETGTASSGISVARQPCRKMKTTRIDQRQRIEQREHNFVNAGGDGFGRIERNA